MPIQRIREKSFVDAGPKKKSVARTIITVSDVLIERVKVWRSDVPTVVAKSFETLSFKFSRIRSNTTMVSWTENDIVVQSTIAGVDQNDIDIAVTNDMVTIKGKRAMQEKIRSSDYYYQELFWGPFSRSIILPEDVDSDTAKASMKNGLLTIRLPKLAKTKIKKIKIG